MAVFARQIELAQRMIAKYGQDVVINQIPITVPNVNEPWKVNLGTPVPSTVKMLFLSTNLVNREFLRYLIGTELKSGNTKALMAFGSVVPKMNDVITRNSSEMIIKSVDPLAPNDETVLYTIEFTK